MLAAALVCLSVSAYRYVTGVGTHRPRPWRNERAPNSFDLTHDRETRSITSRSRSTSMAVSDQRDQPRDGFSLVETLVVLGLIGILLGLLLPAIQSGRASAGRIGCQNNLKQIGAALHNYHSAHGRIPPLPADSRPSGPFGLPSDPNRLLSWVTVHGSVLPLKTASCGWLPTGPPDLRKKRR
jgi:prepilin-type N-terminal cleavage/methylation domain-containing protein